MPRSVNMHQAKSQLSQLVQAVESGAEKEIVIARAGKPVARLVAVEERPARIRLGLFEGRFHAPSQEEFDSMNDEIARMFYGEDHEPSC